MTDWIGEFSVLSVNDIKYLKFSSIEKLILSITALDTTVAFNSNNSCIAQGVAERSFMAEQ